jgi:uncharacterized protein (DUF111 family)
VRWSYWQRTTLPRAAVQVLVGPPGDEHQITVKVAVGPKGHRTAKPELAEAERIAQKLGWPVRRVCEAAKMAFACEWQTAL